MKPVIGICNSWSELTHCNIHLRRLAEAVKRGVWAAGGVPLEVEGTGSRIIQVPVHIERDVIIDADAQVDYAYYLFPGENLHVRRVQLTVARQYCQPSVRLLRRPHDSEHRAY